MTSRLPSRRELRAQAAAGAQATHPSFAPQFAPVCSDSTPTAPVPVVTEPAEASPVEPVVAAAANVQAPAEPLRAALPSRRALRAAAVEAAPAEAAPAVESPALFASPAGDSLAAAVTSSTLAASRHGAPRQRLRRPLLLGAGAVGAALAMALVLPNVMSANATNALGVGESNQAAAPELRSSVLTELHAAESQAEALAAVPQAASRARARQALADPVKPCTVDVSTAADGLRAAYATQSPLYRPMLTGTYEMTSPFGYRNHPVRGSYTFHEGVDYAAPIDTPIYAPADGVVKEIVTDGYGTSMLIQHEGEELVFDTAYLHLYPHTVYVEVGQQVKAGQHIAGVGNSGISTGPHLHFEVHIEGKVVDPEAFLVEHAAVDPGTCN